MADIYGGGTHRYLPEQHLKIACQFHAMQAFLFYMATVFDRLTLLGLPYDKHKISAAGESVSAYFISKDSATSYARIKVDQLEPVGTVRVWCYNDEYDSVIDGILINLYKPKRKRING